MPLPAHSRRTFLATPAIAAAAAVAGCTFVSCGSSGKWARLLRDAGSEAFAPGGAPLADVLVERKWNGAQCALRLRNAAASTVRVGDVHVFDLAHGLPPETPLYAEGYQMLSQTGGTVGDPQQIGGYTDRKHYRLPAPDGAFTGYNLIEFPQGAIGNPLLAFTSCHRFSGKFHLRPDRLVIALDLDGIELDAGETINLESFQVFEGQSAQQHYTSLAESLRGNHPPIHPAQPPEGWCSWYCFGPTVTAAQIISNLDFIASQMPSLRYIQIDDGYQSAMGDWLETGNAFGGDVRAVLREIKQRGFEPAIWVAPFIAEASSNVFREHPDWFMAGTDGQPLPSNEVTFGGWRRGPWYALDASHPQAQQHLETVFRTMRQEWGVTYFKLDANFWGTMPQGRLHDSKATRIEAYRRGMEAICRGAGDAFLLGCNHPLWPSLGLIHGSRSSNDISRNWSRFKRVARENLMRGWQNGKLWWNDPDVVLLLGDLTEDEFHFHAASIYASGGMLLAGDDLPQLPPDRLAILRKLSPPTGEAAVFDSGLQEGWLRRPDGDLLFLFNWSEQSDARSVEVKNARYAEDFFTGKPVSIYSGNLVLEIPPHGAKVLTLRHDKKR